MTKQLETLWKNISKRNFIKAQTIIDENPEYVNAINEEGYSVLMASLSLGYSIEFIAFIANHPQFNNFSHINPEFEDTAIELILTIANSKILDIFIGKQNLVLNQTELTYTYVLRNFQSSTNNYQTALLADPNSTQTQQCKARKDEFAIMAQKIFDLTFNYACSNDDATLLAQLRKMQDPFTVKNMNDALATLSKRKDLPKIQTWITGMKQELSTTVEESTQSLLDSRREIDLLMQQYQKQILAQQQAVFFKSAEQQAQTTSELGKILKGNGIA